MLFKGTPTHPKGALDRLLARYGAMWNAFTNEDVTCYFETVPKARYQTALALEADRMRNALISVEETEAERTVIVSEREGLENDPSFLLGEELQAVAFSRHPYGQGVIGSKDEIKIMPRDGLYAHYRRFYAPNNAYVVVVGDDDAARLVEMAAKAFSALEPSKDLGQPPQAPEPAQHGERRIVVHRAGGALPLVMVAFKSPRATDPRAPALAALAVTLAGTSSGSDGASGRSSRLHRAIVEKGLATDVDVSFRLTKDPHLFWIDATLRPETKHGEVERVILRELEKVASDLISESEFARVKRQLLAATAFGTDTVTWRAYRAGEILSTGAATSIADWYEKLAAVTREQIRDAAAATFVESTRNVGWFIPEAAD
jgi:zinc protease